MQDADEHYFNVRQPHDRTIESVRKLDSVAYSQLMMCKLRRRHFNKLEAMKARHHMNDATNITLPS